MYTVKKMLHQRESEDILKNVVRRKERLLFRFSSEMVQQVLSENFLHESCPRKNFHHESCPSKNFLHESCLSEKFHHESCSSENDHHENNSSKNVSISTQDRLELSFLMSSYN